MTITWHYFIPRRVTSDGYALATDGHAFADDDWSLCGMAQIENAQRTGPCAERTPTKPCGACKRIERLRLRKTG